MRPLRALVPLALLVLCGGRCDPFGDPEGHEFLYLAILPPDTAFVFPPEAELRDAMEEVAAYFLETSYGVHVAEGVAAPLEPGDLVGPLATDIPLWCGLETFFVARVLEDLGPTLDFRPYEHVVVMAPGIGCSLNGQDVPLVSVAVPGGGFTDVDPVYANAKAVFVGGGGAVGPGIIAHELGATRFEWDLVDLLATVSAPPESGDEFQADLDVPFEDVGDQLAVAVYDRAGNGAREISF